MNTKNDKFKQLCHFVAGIALLPVAFKLFAKNNFKLSIIFIALGIVFLIISATFETLETRLGKITKLSYLLESVAIAFTAVVQFWMHKKSPTIMYAGLSAVYFLLFLYFLYGKDEKKKKRKRKSSSTSHKQFIEDALNANNTPAPNPLETTQL